MTFTIREMTWHKPPRSGRSDMRGKRVHAIVLLEDGAPDVVIDYFQTAAAAAQALPLTTEQWECYENADLYLDLHEAHQAEAVRLQVAIDALHEAEERSDTNAV